MLEQIRRNRRLGTTVLLLCVVLWLVALWAGVRVRAMPGPAPVAAMAAASPTESHAAAHVHGTHAAHNSPHAVVSEGEAAPASAPEHSGHGPHGPDCVLCIALSPPAAVAVVVYRPPVPRQGLGWRAPERAPLSRQAAAPLPARGPPAALHA